MPELEGRDVRQDCNQWDSICSQCQLQAGGNAPESTAQSVARPGLQNRQQKGIWKRILPGLIKTAHKPDKLNLQKIPVDSPSVPNKKGAA